MPRTLKIGLFGCLLIICSCSQTPPKDDWLDQAPEISQDAGQNSSQDEDTLSNVGHASHTGTGHR